MKQSIIIDDDSGEIKEVDRDKAPICIAFLAKEGTLLDFFSFKKRGVPLEA
jgi:hypothetical protein